MTPTPCLECGCPRGDRARAVYCSRACNAAHNNRRMLQGAVVYDLAMRWRKVRTGDSFTDLCHVLDGYLYEDREAGRQSWNKHTVIKSKTYRQSP